MFPLNQNAWLLPWGASDSTACWGWNKMLFLFVKTLHYLREQQCFKISKPLSSSLSTAKLCLSAGILQGPLRPSLDGRVKWWSWCTKPSKRPPHSQHIPNTFPAHSKHIPSTFQTHSRLMECQGSLGTSARALQPWAGGDGRAGSRWDKWHSQPSGECLTSGRKQFRGH